MAVKKVLFVNRRLSVGGSERVMTILANGIAQSGVQVDMVVLQDMGRTYKVNDNVKVIQFQDDKLNPVSKAVKRTLRLRKVIKEGNYDSIVSFMHLVNFYTLIAGFGNKNIVISERGEPRKNRGLVMKLGRAILYPMAKMSVFQTEDAKSFFSGKIQNKSVIIVNPINDELPEPYSGEREKSIVAIGRFTSQKNFKMAIDAFDMLHKEFPEHRLVIYGDGPLRNELVEYSKVKEAKDFYEFPGFVQDIPAKIAKAGMYISSSDYEGISNAMLEAMAMGIPSVCTDCPVGGARMMIDNNENGILVPVGDTKALYEGMKKVLSDKDFAYKLSENAVKIREKYSVETICKQWLEVLGK